MNPLQPLLDRRAAAEYVRRRYGARCSPAYLAKFAVSGDGPRFVKFGRFPLYDADELDRWVRSRMSLPKDSTSAQATSLSLPPELADALKAAGVDPIRLLAQQMEQIERKS